MATTVTAPDLLTPSEDSARVIPHWIDGKRVAGTSGRYSDVYNPATGQVQATCPLASAEELNLAVESCRKAAVSWGQQPPLRRARVLFRFRDLFEQNLDKLAAIITSEHGKVLSDAKGEATRGMEVVEFATGIPQLLKGEFSEQVGTSIDSWSCGSRSASSPASHRSTFRQWFRCGCSPLRSPAAMHSC
jgi:malonate-semialdehyde dehydrogenase (acetylating) / methylmalonate-semialdehyde dehydrogenase